MINKKNIYGILLIIVFVIFSFFIPISGDDYGCYIDCYGNIW